MPRLTAIIGLLLVIGVGPALAVDYYRCSQADGTTVFSEQPCAPDARLQSLEAPGNPDGNGPSRSAIEQLRNYRARVKRIDQLTGTSKRPTRSRQDPCENITSLQLRNARVSRDLMRCHSISDVQAMFGTPDAISTWSERRAYDTRYLYRDDNERLYIYFNNGLVTRWRTQQ